MGNKSRRNHPLATQQTTIIKQSYSGPLPLAAEMERYANIDPTLPDRIMSLAEQQSIHRQRLENMAMASSDYQRRRGSYCATTIALSSIAGGVWCITQGYSAQGLAAILVPIAALAGAFIYGTKSEKKEHIEKWRQVEPGNKQ